MGHGGEKWAIPLRERYDYDLIDHPLLTARCGLSVRRRITFGGLSVVARATLLMRAWC